MDRGDHSERLRPLPGSARQPLDPRHGPPLGYEAANGPIPDGIYPDHLCHTNDHDCPGGTSCPHRRCVNPDHLDAVGDEENRRRGRARAHKKAT